MISAYLDTLTQALSFDRALARGVRQEVEDHLWETVAADPQPDRAAAERQAIARFGAPHAIAVQFAMAALARRTRRACAALVVAVAVTLATMKARVAWYAAMQWTTPADARAAGAMVLLIDRCAFWLAVALGAAALAHAIRQRIGAGPERDHHRRLRRSVILCAGAALCLALAVTCDGLLTALQLATALRLDAVFPVAATVPLALMIMEIGCAVAVSALLLDAGRRSTAVSGLLKP